MLSEGNTQTLNYGHIISLSPPDDPNSFIFSDGFIKTRTILKNFRGDEPSSKYLRCLFQIYPSFLNSGKKAALCLSQELETNYSEVSAQKRKEIIMDAQEKVAHEYRFNQETYEKLKDTPIPFDTQVQFLHISSNKFLACVFEEADYEKENFRLELNDYPSENTFFKFLPVFTYQKRSDGSIFLHDTVNLVWASQYLNKIPYVHVSEPIQSVVHQEESKIEESPESRPRIKSEMAPFSPRHEESINHEEDKTDEINEKTDLKQYTLNIFNPNHRKTVVAEKSPIDKKNYSPFKSEDREDLTPLKSGEMRGSKFFPNLEDKIKKKEKEVQFVDKGIPIDLVLKKGVNFAKSQVTNPNELVFSKRFLSSNNKLNSMILEKDIPIPKREVNISLDSKSLWKLNLNRGNITDSNILCYGDVIWLNYSEKNATLIVSNRMDILNTKNMVYKVDFVMSSFSEQQYQNFIGDTNGMWIIEHENYKKGGMIEWSSPLRLKHFNSGKYLSINADDMLLEEEEKEGSKQKKDFFEMIDVPAQNTLFEFTILPTTINQNNRFYLKYISKDAFIKLRHVASRSWICINFENTELQGVKNLENANTGLTNNAGDEIAFKIFKANPNEIWESNFLISCSPIIKKMITFFKEIEDSPNKFKFLKDKKGVKIEKKMRNMNRCLLELNMFTKNELVNTSPDQKYGMVNPYRQKILRELYVLDDCVKLLKISLTEKELIQYVENIEKKNLDKKQNPNETNLFTMLVNKMKTKEKGTFFDIYNKLEDLGEKKYNIFIEKKVKMVEMIYELLINICKDCSENENYLYNKINSFQFQAKYLKSAVDCIISIISNNELLLNNIADDIKIQKDKGKNETKNEMNLLMISMAALTFSDKNKDTELIKPTLSKFLEFARSNENNLIMFFLKITQDQASSKIKNPDYLKFFRSICKFQNKAMSMNQEILHKLLEDDMKDNKKSIFLPIKIESKKMKIEFDGKTKFLDDLFKDGPNSIIVQENFPYFLEQLNLFSDLSLGRNFLWKKYLEKIFPIDFIFSELANEKLSKEMRSTFCNLALTLYVDHEPLNPLIVPNMCRVFELKEKKLDSSPTKFGIANIGKMFIKAKERSPEKKDSTKNMLEKNLFQFLTEQSFKYINEEKIKINEALDKIYKENEKEANEKINNHKDKKSEVTDFLNNVLTLDIIRLSSTLIKFDILRILNQTEKLSVIVPDLIALFEFDQKVPAISFCLAKLRNDKLEKTQNIFTKNRFLSGFKDALGSVVDNITEISKSLSGSIFGSEGDKSGSSGVGVDLIDYNDPLFYKNPIMRGLISIKNKLDLLLNTEENKFNVIKSDILIKMEICDLLIFFNDLRVDFLISNFLSFYQDKIQKLLPSNYDRNEMENKLNIEVENFGGTIIPPLLETGISEVDLKYKVDTSNIMDVMNVMGGVMKNVKIPLIKGKQISKIKKFINYTDENEIPDLDTLLANKADGNIKSEILPSLLMVFYLNTDYKLENKILEFITKCFNQRTEYVEKLKGLEILFDSNDIKLYNIIKKKIHRLRILAERSEIWISEFLSDYENCDSINEILILIKDINGIFYKKNNNFNDEKNGTEEKKELKFEEISKTRQNIFRFVKGYIPLISLIKDGQNQMAKIMKDNKIPIEKRKLFYEIMKYTYLCLKHFCMKNSENQKLLFPFIDYLLDEIVFDYGQTSLVSKIFENNKYLCENVLNTFDSLKKIIEKNGRQSRFLEFFKVIQICEDTYLIDNQILVANSFLPIGTSLAESAVLMFGNYGDNEKSHFSFDFNMKYNNFSRDEPYYYHSELIEVLTLTIKGIEGQNINLPKLQEIIKLKNLLPYLNEEDNFYIRKKNKNHNLLFKPDLFNEDYNNIVENKTNLFELTKEKGNSIIKPLILDCLNMIYLNPSKVQIEKIYKNLTYFLKFLNFELQRLLNINDFAELYNDEISYIFDYLLSFLKNYHKKIIPIDSTSNEINDREDYIALNEIYNILLGKLDKLKGRINKEQIHSLYQFLNSFKDAEMNKEKLNNILLIEETEIHLEDNNDTNGDSKNLHYLWDCFLKTFVTSSLLEEELKNERNILGEALINIDKLFTPEMKKKYKIDIKFQDLLQKLINFLNYGIANKADKKTMIYVLNILENIINNSPKLVEIQNFFDKFDATKMFLNLISDSKVNIIEDDLLIHLLSFMITLLREGNTKVQKTIHNFFIYYSKSEILFWKFHGIISEAITYVNENKRTLNSSTISNFQSEVSNENDQKIALKSDLLTKTLRLLQLFTEGHNLNLQNYVRFQTNSRNNYDMVSVIAELLEAYHKSLSIDNYENYVKCLETLTEFVQGPCPSNQQSIIDGKFLEIANSLLSMKCESKKKALNGSSPRLEKKKTLKNKLSKEIDTWMLERLKNKCMTLVISLVEMKKDNSVLKRIVRSLPLEILKQNIIWIYKKYKKLYGGIYTEECLNHTEGDPQDRDNDKKEDYYECIIETGFSLYFLILHYLELDIKELDADISHELQEIESDVNQTSKGLLNFNDNILGQIIEFTRSLVESLFYYADYIKSKIWKFQFNSEDKEKLKEKKKRELYKEAIIFFSQNSAHIEVVRNDELEKVNFIVLPYCHYLPKESKVEFHAKVNRTSVKSKVSDLVDESKMMIEIAKNEEKLAVFLNKNKIIAIFAKYVKLWKDLAFLITIILNLFIVLSYSVIPTDKSFSRRIDEPSLLNTVSVADTSRLFDILGILMAVCTSFVISFFILKKAPLIIKKAFDNPDKEEENKKKKGFMMKIFDFIYKCFLCLYYLLTNFMIVYYLSYGVLALIGVIYHEFFFTFHMTEILVRFPYIIKAVWEPKKQLFLTLILFILIEYFFAVIGYVSFYKWYGGRCGTVLFCFFETFDNTFKDNGGLGSFFEKVDPETPNNYSYKRFFFENVFNIVLVIILINIVAGIIIDKFGDLRENDDERMKDIEGKCFICGNSREIFERKSDKKGGGFTTHIKKDHYMWNYVFYIAYLDYKDPTEYTGIESYIETKRKNYDFSWFPMNRAMALNAIEANEEETVNKQLLDLDNEINGIKKSVKDLKSYTANLTTKKNG